LDPVSMEPIDKHSHGWIQWKGTDVCMDVYCECGYHGHVDCDFAYYIKCPCGRVYEVDSTVRLTHIPGSSVPQGHFPKSSCCDDYAEFLADKESLSWNQ